jgi:hypothetical protein
MITRKGHSDCGLPYTGLAVRDVRMRMCGTVVA